MESLLVEQSFSPRNQIKNHPKWKTHQHVVNNNNPHQLNQIGHQLSNNISRQGSLNQNYAPPQVMMHEFDMNMMNMMHGGFFLNNHHAPPYNYHVSNSLPPMPLAHHHQPPPLLPLPTVSRPAFRSLPPHPPLVSKRTPTKHKSPPKKENKKGSQKNNNKKSSAQLSAANNQPEKTKAMTDGLRKESGPDPGTLAKDLTRILLADLDGVVDEMDKFSGSVFSLAPHPSSLPLPKFFLRQSPQRKLSCNAEAAAAVAEVVDCGSSDNLSKLLKLR
ncbi:hypothetical protein RND81_02G066700 [Saponaria officinalis]|uniref:Uncharacterized protein n=1 Tax=Saponaria officinalis TaxID=3572 RepID=A0AAW1MRP2_SAPOF